MASQKQLRIDQIFGGSSAKVPDKVLDEKTCLEKVNMEVIKREVNQEKQAEELGEQFVPNGSRDRFGKLRANVGGRPKKPQGLAGPEQKSNRRQPGKFGKKEIPAREKLQMIDTICQMEQSCAEQYRDQDEATRRRQLVGAVRRRFPTLQTTKKVEALLQDEGRLREVVHKRRLGADLSATQKKQRGGSRKASEVGRGAAGVRRPGGGRKNQFEKFWMQVKIWHACQRLCGVPRLLLGRTEARAALGRPREASCRQEGLAPAHQGEAREARSF